MSDELASLAPYEGQVFRDALHRVLANPLLPHIVKAYYPEMPMTQLIGCAEPVRNADDFQRTFIDPLIRTLLHKTSTGISVGGADRLPAGVEHVYLSTHRDIVLDPGLFAWSLFNSGRRTCQICLGDNLLADPWIRDLMKINKGVTVKRDASPRELLRWSTALSEYIRGRVTGGSDSIWLAQREGRAKDGDDRTQPGVLKMLVLSGEGSAIERLRALNVVPVSISYEYEPCDILKAREVFLTEKLGEYRKAPGEDAESMRRSFGGWKGGIHIEIGGSIDPILDEAVSLPSRNDQLRKIGEGIDRVLHRGYRLWPTNFLAVDLLNGDQREAARYTAEQRDRFVERMDKRIASAAADEAERAGIRRHFLLLYANPVFNARARNA